MGSQSVGGTRIIPQQWKGHQRRALALRRGWLSPVAGSIPNFAMHARRCMVAQQRGMHGHVVQSLALGPHRFLPLLVWADMDDLGFARLVAAVGRNLMRDRSDGVLRRSNNHLVKSTSGGVLAHAGKTTSRASGAARILNVGGIRLGGEFQSQLYSVKSS